MRAVGIFEAKAKLSEICDDVARTGRSVLVTRRGRPLVRIDPIGEPKFSVWETREAYLARKGRMREEFDVPARSPDLPSSPIED